MIAALVLLLAGFLGLILPVLPGLVFIALGLLLISLYSLTMRTWITNHTKPYPRLSLAIEKTQKWLAKFVGKL